LKADGEAWTDEILTGLGKKKAKIEEEWNNGIF